MCKKTDVKHFVLRIPAKLRKALGLVRVVRDDCCACFYPFVVVATGFGGIQLASRVLAGSLT